jgi:hypothetical protein
MDASSPTDNKQRANEILFVFLIGVEFAISCSYITIGSLSTYVWSIVTIVTYGVFVTAAAIVKLILYWQNKLDFAIRFHTIIIVMAFIYMMMVIWLIFIEEKWNPLFIIHFVSVLIDFIGKVCAHSFLSDHRGVNTGQDTECPSAEADGLIQ